MITESSLSTVEIGLDSDFKAFYIREEKRREKKEGEKRERERAQMGEIDFVDTQTDERERE
jgi:CelD/BcsL family acetyltransferase involved in cellulose biosynthesis